MFEEQAHSKFLRYASMVALAIAVLWLAAYAIRSAQHKADERAATAALQELAREAGKVTSTAATELMQPVHDATTKALNDIHDNTQRRLAEQRARQAAEREARVPKAYRWKDEKGEWRLSDQAPPEGVEAEVIRLPAR